MAAMRSALLRHLQVRAGYPLPSRSPPVSLSLSHLLRCFSGDVKGSFLDKSEVTDRVVTVVKNFQKVDPSKDFDNVFPEKGSHGLPLIRGIEHQINFVLGASIPHRPTYKNYPGETKKLQKQVEEQMEKGYVREITSPYAVPVILVSKKDETLRMCVDCRAINNIMVTPKAHFHTDLGLDSLDTVEVVMALEEEFGFEIPDNEADKINSIDIAVDFIASHPQAK